MIATLKNSFRSLRTQKTRLILTIFAIAWGTTSIGLMLAVGEGLRVTFVRAMQGSGAGIIAVSSGVTSKNYLGHGKHRKINLTKPDLIALKHNKKISQSATAEIEFNATLHYQNKTTFAAPTAVTPNFATLRDIKVRPGGRFINPIDEANHRRVIVLGNTIAHQLFAKKNPVGKTISLGNWPFLIVGVMQPKFQISMYSPPDANHVWIPMSVYHLLANNPFYSDIVVKPKTNISSKQLETSIRKTLAPLHQFSPNDKAALNLIDFKQQQEKTAIFMLGLQIFLGLIGSITLIVAGIGVANVMLFSVNRARKEIAIKMALGANVRKIVSQFLIECLLVTLVGGLAGLGLTKLFVLAINSVPIHSQLFQFFGRPEPMLSYPVLLAVLLSLGLVGLIAGLFPALTAAKTNPAEALREE